MSRNALHTAVAVCWLAALAAASGSGVEYKAYPFLVEDGEKPALHEVSRTLLSELDASIDVTAFLGLTADDPVLVNLHLQRLAGDHPFTPVEPTGADGVLAWLIKAGETADGRKRLVLAMSVGNCWTVSNATKDAFSILAVSAHKIFLNFNFDEALSAQADLTYRLAHISTSGDAAQFAPTPEDASSGVPVRLAPLSVWVNTMMALGEARDELHRDLQCGADPATKVSLYRDIEVRSLSVMNGVSYSTPFTFGASDVALLGDFVQPELTELAAVADATSDAQAMWALSGEKFALWIPYVSGHVAPPLYVEREPPHFVEEIKRIAINRALQGFRNELKGAIHHGWVINEDGSTVKAIAPSSEHVEAQESQARALVNIDLPSNSIALRPPSEVELETLRKSAEQRAEAFVRRFFAKLSHVDVEPSLARLREEAEAIYTPLKAKNDANVEQYVTVGVQRTSDAYTKKIYDLYVKIPMTKATVDDRLADCKKNAAADLKVLLGTLETSEHAQRGLAKVHKDLESSAADQHMRNNKKVAGILATASEDAVTHLEGQAPQLDLPMGPSTLSARLADMCAKAFERCTQHLEAKLGAAVLSERAAEVQEMTQKLRVQLDFFGERVRGENEEKIGQVSKSYASQMSSQFHQRVVQGKGIAYPGNEGVIFDLAATEATGMLVQFNKSLEQFAECEAFAAEMHNLEKKLQDQICSDGQSVMTRNTEEYAKEKWVVKASNVVEMRIKENEKEAEYAAKYLQDQMEKHGGTAFQDLSRSMVKRITSYWCSTYLGGDCPGNCYKWDTNVLTHSLDVAGFCEESWVWCNPRAFGSQPHYGQGAQWKADSPFRRCEEHEYKPCKTFWDQKGLSIVKYFLRVLWVAAVGAFIASRLLESWRRAPAAPVRQGMY